MRWEALFADLEGQFAQVAQEERDEEVADLAEAERSQVKLADRLRARQGQDVSLRLRDGSDVRGTVRDAAVQWLLVADGPRRALVPAEAVAVARALGAVAPEAPVVERRLRLTHVLRALAREEADVVACTTAGDYRGRIVAVGADHLDLQRPTGEVVAIVLAHLLVIRTG